MMLGAFGNVEQQLFIWLLAMIRPGAAFLAAPIFGAASVPVQLRIILALAVGIPAASASQMGLPVDGIFSLQGMLFIFAEVLAGLAMGFALQIGFASALLAGEVISNTMGLGFASMADPVGGQMSPAIGQFLSMLATFLFLALDGHLAFVSMIVESYRLLPPGNAWISVAALGSMVKFGGLVFAAGLSIALPVGFAMVLVQVIMAVIARSTPTLNLFSVGMPATLLAGVVLLA
ncbi:MAG: flagellar biosynthetic protein FliR, partial [Sphingorhabdus sp.]